MDDPPARDPFAILRIEHRPPDGPARLLTVSTSWTDAMDSAGKWAGVLARQGRRGTVVAVDAATGDVRASHPIPAERAPRIAQDETQITD